METSNWLILIGGSLVLGIIWAVLLPIPLDLIFSLISGGAWGWWIGSRERRVREEERDRWL